MGRGGADSLAQVARFCGVFSTAGDRRLGDHLLGGLEVLLPCLLPLDAAGLKQLARDVNARRGLSSSSGGGSGGGSGGADVGADVGADGEAGELFPTDMLRFVAEPPPPPADCVDLAVPCETAPPSTTAVAAASSSLSSSSSSSLSSPAQDGFSGEAPGGVPGCVPGGSAAGGEAGCSGSALRALGLTVPPLFAEVWDDAVATLACHTGGTGGGDGCAPGTVVMGLAWRLGFECGRVLFVLGEGRVSWGTYPDSLGTHCNAHANNMVVLPTLTPAALAAAEAADAATEATGAPERPERSLLAPLDFDMAFTEDAYVFLSFFGGGVLVLHSFYAASTTTTTTTTTTTNRYRRPPRRCGITLDPVCFRAVQTIAVADTSPRRLRGTSTSTLPGERW